MSEAAGFRGYDVPMSSGDPLLVVVSLTPSARTPSRVMLRVGRAGSRGRIVATLSVNAVERLGVGVGTAWTEQLSRRALDEAAYEKTLADGMRIVNRRAVSVTDLRGRLTSRGHAAVHIERAVQRMIQIGAVNDAALARELIDVTQSKRPVGEAALRDKLARRGIDEKIIDEQLGEHRSSSDPVADAMGLATKKLAAMHGHDAATRRRRLWGVLARRGFEQEVIEAVLERLGLAGEDAAISEE